MTISLYRRERSPYWWMRLARLDEFGKVISTERVSTRRTEKSEAKLVAAAYSRNAMNSDQLGVRDTATIQETAERYIAELKSEGKPSVKDYAIFLRNLESSKSREPISRLDRKFLSSLRAKLLAADYSASYVNNQLTFWITVYTKAKRDYMLKVSEVDTRGLKLKKKEKTRYLLDGEEQKLLTELNPHREVKGMAPALDRAGMIQRKLQDQHDLVVFLLDTGARYSEVAEIPWSAVDVHNWKYINLYREKVGNEGNLAITARLQAILERRHRESNHPYVFAGYTDAQTPRGYSTSGIRKAIMRAELNAEHLVKRYGKFTPHSLRHTFASRLVQGGMSLYGVSKLLGHSSESMTKRYAFLSPSMVADQAVTILNKNNMHTADTYSVSAT